MTLSKEEFTEQSIEFVKQCQQYGDTWFLMTRRGDGRFKELFELESIGSLSSFDELILTKNEMRNHHAENGVWAYEYSVIYNGSYEVPVIYFSVSDQDGCPVPVEKVVRTNPGDLSRVVSQAEHPLLFRPFYMVHPCRTEDFMGANHSENKCGYLISWLSVVATLVDLRLDHRLALEGIKKSK